MLRDSTRPLEPGDDWYDAMSHTRTLGEKDLTLALELADDLGLDLPLARQALQDLASGLGVPHRPTSAVDLVWYADEIDQRRRQA